MDRRTTKTTHYSLVALICVLIVTFALGMGGVATAGQDVAKTDAVSGFSKVGNFDMETLRQQYFSQTAVQETTASYSGKRWVIVELEGDSLFTSYENRGYWYGDFTTYCNSEEGKLLKADIEASHKDFLAVLDNNRIDYKYKYSYSTLNNGVALKVDADTFNEIKKLDGVKSVYYSESYAIPTVAVSNNANVYTTGIYDSSNLSYKGEGMVVAVLDTGLDYSHEAFSTMPSNPAWTKEYVAAKMAASTRFNAQATVDEVYYNSKVPFAYDYADDDADVYPSYSTHGTHVAGIVAGKSDYVVNKETDETFVGVAPEAQLVICKVFTDNLDSDSLGGADTIDIIAAVSDCVELGVDVINMSLGSSAGFSNEKSDELINEVYNRVRAAGISLVVAASNDYSSGFGGGNGTNLASNPDSGTVGSPSTYGAALSVASINGQKATFIQANNDENQVAFITESSDANGNEYDFVERLYNIAGKSKGDTLNFKYVVVGGVGRATNYTSKIRRELQDKTGYDGTIALIKRGDTTFADKVQTAMDNGADAVIIYNNLSGTIRMSLGDVNNPVPTCSIPMDAGKVFVEKADKGVGSVQINSEFKAGPFMSDFSSWGPTPDLQLKPEITAHGGEITSAVPGGYDVYSGTSMAAPNMSGAVALLRQHLKTANPTLTGVELNARVNQVLMSTATIALNDEGNPYSPRKQGAGLAGIADAINAESFITVKDKDGNVRDKTKVELYDDKQKTGIYEFEFTINNISGKIEQYDPTVYVMTETLASDNKTVAEKAYMLSDSTIEYVVDGAPHTESISVGADGKIDMDSFALEDPTMAAGYTFKGWFGQDDSTIEFDEDATFTQNTIFVSKIEKTGYVLTFKKSASDSEPVVVVVDKATGKLAASQIPADLTYEDGSVFTGWYTTAGVKAVADLTITQDTTFIAKSVKESDYEGYWINTTSGKEALAIIADGKVTFGYGVSGVDYTFNAEDGSLKFTATISYMKHTYVVTKTVNGISISDSYYDRSAEQDVSNVYELTAPKSNSLAKSCAGTYQCSNSEIIAVLENGIVTKYDGNATTYGYISGTISNVKIVYKTGSSSSVTTKTGKYDAKSLVLVLGGKIYVKNPSAFASYYNSNNGTFYVYTREGKATLYTYKGTSYATIDGELAIGNVVTVSYTDADGKAQSFVAKITGKTAYDVAGAERGTFTAEGKDSIVFDGFGSATIGEKAYSYLINKKNVVVLKSDSETIGVTLDSEAKTYAIVTGDGFARSYADANSEYYTVEFDGFGGVNVIDKSKSSTTVYAGTYTLGTGTVTIKGATYSYNKEYTVEESGNVLVSADGSKVLKVAGYVVENKVEQFNGYYVNGDENIEISVAKDKTATILLNGVAVKKVSVNWNGTVLTFDADDYDAPKEGWTSEFTIVKDGDNVKLSHACKQSYDSIYEEFETIQKDIVFTKSTKPSAATDGLEGTYKSGSNVIVLDGKGNGTFNGVAFTYSGTGSTKQVSAFGAFSGSANTFTVTATGIDVSFDDEYQENTFKASFTKQA